MKRISILGSTGSIGTQALDVCRKHDFKIVALTANSNINLLEKQAREFLPKYVGVSNQSAYEELKLKLADTSIKVMAGLDGICEIAALEENDIVLNSVVGMVGLLPTLSAIRAKNDVALANKETLVVGGQLVCELARKNGVKILPVDSEHSAIFQCLQGSRHSEVKKIILTASGGPFFGKTQAELKNVTVKQALNHPNWNMGAKITIDSATMMNKGLELIEAVWLFSKTHEDVEIVVHRESVVHSLVEFVDHSIIAQLGVPDMRVPIQFALTYPDRHPSPAESLSLTDYPSLSFAKPDYKTFQALQACKIAIERGGLYPCAVNCANEEAVRMFLEGKIGFLDIGALALEALNYQKPVESFTVNDILKKDIEIREYIKKIVSKY